MSKGRNKMSEHTYADVIDLGEAGEVEVEVSYDYQPYEAPVMNPIDEAHPGCAESAEINSIVVTDVEHPFCNVEILPLVSAEWLKECEDRILSENHGDNGYGWNGEI